MGFLYIKEKYQGLPLVSFVSFCFSWQSLKETFFQTVPNLCSVCLYEHRLKADTSICFGIFFFFHVVMDRIEQFEGSTNVRFWLLIKSLTFMILIRNESRNEMSRAATVSKQQYGTICFFFGGKRLQLWVSNICQLVHNLKVTFY